MEDGKNNGVIKGVRIFNEGDDDSQKPDKKKKITKKRPLSSKQMKDGNMKKRLDNLNSTTRWLADSSFQTYFGKPAFHLYGKNNTNPSVGGNIYG
jgi:hypothetical protein